MHHVAEPRGKGLATRHLERLAGVLDALLGPADPLRHGRLGHEERPGDLRGGEAADRAQGERDRGGRGERRVAAHEEQVERVVALGRPPVLRGQSDLLVGRHQADHQLLAVAASGLGADLIGDAPRGHLDQPPARVLGQALSRPLRRRGDEGLLHRVLRSGKSR